MALHQVGTVAEFIEEFEMVAALVPRQPELQYLGYFLNGLKEEIRNKVLMHQPTTRIGVMRLARMAEATLSTKVGGGGGITSCKSWVSRDRKGISASHMT